MKKKFLTAISLFAGAGGDTLGLERAGFKIVGFVENWKPAIETHTENFPEALFIGEKYGGDITKIPDKEFIRFKEKIDIVFAGFPCQGFSHAGKKDPNDPRNKLFWEFVRATNLIKPKWVIGENVWGLLHRKTDDGKAFVSDVIVSAFEEIGYKMANPKILNSVDYGVPQKRRRVFFIGNREGLNFEFPNRKVEKENYPTIKRIVEFSLEGAVKIDPKRIGIEIEEFCESDGKEKPYGIPHPYLLRKLKEKNLSYSKRISPYHAEIVDLRAPAKTIHCGYSFQPRLFVPLKNKLGIFIRPFTTRELAQIQGFPKEFIFHGSRNQIITQIGNAVPHQMVEAIAKKIISIDPSMGRNDSKNYF